MALSALSNTYQLYKQDTTAVATWLALTARSHGKARAEAKKQATAEKLREPSKYVIEIKDFVPLAEHVASKAIPVPPIFSTTMDRVIAARSTFGAQLEKHGQTLNKGADARHQHFIRVLEKVREVLKPYMVVDNRNSDAPDTERLTEAQDNNIIYEVEADASFEHAMFGLTAVINDMNRVRSHISWIWSNYKIGVFDLAAAAIATNTAIELVRNMMEDILPLLDDHGGIGDMLQKFHILQCLISGWTEDSIFTNDAKDNFNYDTYDIGAGTYLTVYRLLEAFLRRLQPEHLLVYNEGIFGHYNPKSDRSRKTGWEIFVDDRALLMPFLAEIMAVLSHVHDWPAKDEFYRGLEELSKTRKVPFYTVFSARIFLDIIYELGEDVGTPFSTFVTHTSVMDNDIRMHCDFHANLRINTWPATNDQLMKELQCNIQWILADPLRILKARLNRQGGIEESDIESHRLFRMSPVATGLFLYHFRSRYHEAGPAVAVAWGSIQSCRHLYNALSQSGLLSSRWPDMDVVTTNLGEDSFYVGGETPETLRACFEKFCLQIGISAAAMTKSRRKNTPLQSKSGPRGFKAASPVLSMFKARYVRNTNQVQFTQEDVRRIVELGLFEEEDSGQEGVLRMGQIEDPEKLKAKKKLQQEKNRGRAAAAKRGDIPLEQLIQPLVFALQAETLEYSYPYLHMHRWCWGLLRAVKESCDHILRELYTPAYLENESRLPWIIGWVLMAASGMDGGVSDRRPLQLAAEAMNGFFFFSHYTRGAFRAKAWYVS